MWGRCALLINSPLPKSVHLFNKPQHLGRSWRKWPVRSRSAVKLATSGLAVTAKLGWLGWWKNPAARTSPPMPLRTSGWNVYALPAASISAGDHENSGLGCNASTRAPGFPRPARWGGYYAVTVGPTSRCGDGVGQIALGLRSIVPTAPMRLGRWISRVTFILATGGVVIP
jgi:hypothetical protein